jgi:hypothetical protein
MNEQQDADASRMRFLGLLVILGLPGLLLGTAVGVVIRRWVSSGC